MIRSVSTALAAVTLSLGVIQPAFSAESINEALSEGEASLGLRLRHEAVDQDGIKRWANANTLRTRVGYKSGTYEGASLFLEFDNVSYVGAEHFNNLRNGKTWYPVVADPAGSDLNQSYLNYTFNDNLSSKLGRQRINLDNQRFIGGVGWRQNEQTYDAASATFKAGDITVFYAYLDNVNRIFGPEDGTPAADLNTDSHLFNAKLSASPALNASVYAYVLDFGDADADRLSSTTVGTRFSGSFKDLPLSPGYTAEYASQEEHANNPQRFDADYMLGELSFKVAGFTLLGGREVLGADRNGGVAFQTPLATAHKFQGWADKFLATPATGMDDRYGTVKYSFKGYKMAVTYHDFESEIRDSSYGHEVDAVISRKIGKHYTVLLKVADYDANTFATDTLKYWAMINATF